MRLPIWRTRLGTLWPLLVSPAALALMGLQCAAYVALLSAAALADFHRRDL